MVESKQDPYDRKWTHEEVDRIAAAARDASSGIEVRDRKYHLKTWKQCFVATDLVKWLITSEYAKDESEAITLGNELVEHLHIIHVNRDHDFKNEGLFFRWMADDRDRGHVGDNAASWHQFMEGDPELVGRDVTPPELAKLLAGKSDLPEQHDDLPHVYFDKHNCDMYDNVRPLQWVDPVVPDKKTTGESVYDMVCIGGGAAGMVAAGGTASTGGKSCMIERNFMGGDCLVSGCVPSKALLKSANIIHKARTGGSFGLVIEGEVKVDFPKVMERMRRIRADISVHDSAANFAKHYGTDIYLGHASFKDKNTIEVNGKYIKFLKATICTGGKPRGLKVNGVDDEDVKKKVYNSETIWNMSEQPA